jgi:malonyl-CoA/methylmalonyl-CoA synthetase
MPCLYFSLLRINYSLLYASVLQGVVHTFHSLQAQMEAMKQAWAWSSSDVILHTLPLHHIHGIVNVLMTPLYVGATCIMHSDFDAKKVL